MADEPTVTEEELEQEQAALRVLAAEFEKTRDPEKIEQLTQLVAAQVARLQALVGTYEQEQGARLGVPPDQLSGGGKLPGKVEVELTPVQRRRVKELTGEDVETILIDDPTGIKTQRMARMSPLEVEHLAVSLVLQRQRAGQVREETRQAAEDMLRQMEEADDSPERKEAIAKLRQDPEFLDGVLHEGAGE